MILSKTSELDSRNVTSELSKHESEGSFLHLIYDFLYLNQLFNLQDLPDSVILSFHESSDVKTLGMKDVPIWEISIKVVQELNLGEHVLNC